MMSLGDGMLDIKLFYDEVRQHLFKGRLTVGHVDGIDGILEAFEDYGTDDLRHLGYILATAHHETGGLMRPVREGFAKSDSQARRIVKGRKYGKPAGPFRHVYYGRGHVQLTWIDNYERSSEDAGVDLVEDPDAMLNPIISARILVKGMLDGRWNGRGKGLAEYLNDTRADYKNARRTVNVIDRWQKLKDLSQAYERALSAALVDDLPRPDVPRPKGGGLIDMITGLAVFLFVAVKSIFTNRKDRS